jgi:hypothetical protein
MAITTHSDAGDYAVAARGQTAPVETAFVNAQLSDIKMLAGDQSASYVQNDNFKILLADNSATAETPAQRRQEFVDGFGRLGKLYNDSVNDPGRFAKFQERMQGVFQFDRETFKAMGRIGDSLVANPPASPEQVGRQLADILHDTMKRKGGNIDLSQPEWFNLQSAMAGVMIGAGATFRPQTKAEQNISMVDAMDAQLRQNKVPYVNAIIWGDTKEPGLAIVPPGQSLTRQQRLNFQG